jgi:hypothetical protein
MNPISDPPPASDAIEALLRMSYDNRFTRELPGDNEPRNFRRQVSGAC